MGFVDPERFKRFEQFLNKRMGVFADLATRGFAAKGPGVVVYHAPDDRFDDDAAPLKVEYRAKGEIDAAHAGARDDMLQGMLERYEPPNEALLLALYPDNTYDISRVVLRRPQGGAAAGLPN